MGQSNPHREPRRRPPSLSLSLSLTLLLVFLPAGHCLLNAVGNAPRLSPLELSYTASAGDFTDSKVAEKLSVAHGLGGHSEARVVLNSAHDSTIDRARKSTAEDVIHGTATRAADRIIDSTVEGTTDAAIHRTAERGVDSTLEKSTADRSIRRTVESTADDALRSGVRAVLSEVGLRYAKDVMVTQVLNEIIPLAVPDLTLDMMTPLGPITVNLSDIVLWNATVPDSALLLDEDSGSITLYAGNADANLSASWSFSFNSYLKDHGNATVTTQGLHVVAVGNLTELEGGLVVGVEEVGCAIDQLSISLHSPYSWIYNWLEARLPNHLRAAVQSQVEWSILMIVDELNDFLQELPRAIPVDCSSDLNVTVPHDPVIKSGALLLDCSGQFQESNDSCTAEPAGASAGTRGHRRMNSAVGQLDSRNEQMLEFPLKGRDNRIRIWEPTAQPLGLIRSNGLDLLGIVKSRLKAQGLSVGTSATLSLAREEGLSGCPGPVRMLTLKVLQEVIDSAIQVYYEEGALSFTLRKLPSSFPFQLNTRSWRYLLPSLYRQYPNTDMQLAFVAAGAPNVSLSPAAGIDAAVAASFFLSVVLDEGTKDVLCIDIALHFSALAGLRGNNLTSNARLEDLSVDLRWSTVGSISPALLEGITRTLTKIVLLPLLNFRLAQGFPLPSIPGVAFCNASVVYHRTFLEICTDLEYTGGIFGLPPATAEA